MWMVAEGNYKMGDDRAAKLAAIAEEVRACTACALHTGRIQAVPGAGDPNAEIIFIGEGPGANEDKQGLPFVGRSGDYLNYLLELIDLKREEVFIANVVKCRPPSNRDPLPDEITRCKAYLDRQIEVLDPLVIATLGRFSMARYFPQAKISAIHGQPRYEENRAYYPFYHPAAALRNPNLRHDMEADMHRLLEVVAKVKELRGGSVADVPPPPSPETEDEDPPKQLPLF
jgi:uracil-DNA glycosylase